MVNFTVLNAMLFFVFSILIFFCLIYSPTVFANRPAMGDRTEIVHDTEVTLPEDNRPVEIAPDAPSSVEIMMQQQTRQTGDVLQLPAKEMQPGETLKIKLLDYPRRGMSMDKVQQEYGQPVAITDGVGQPPITSWTYGDRVVYFEYSSVLHVVAR